MSEGKLPPKKPGAPGPADDDDRRLFERELAGVKPLAGPTRVPRLPAGAPPSVGRAPAPARAAGLVLNREGEQVTGARFGVSRELLRELGSGRVRAEATCDLHGLRAEAARRRLSQFIAGSVARDRRVVLVVCGRGLHSDVGGPVLLDLTVTTLAEGPVADHVLAFATAAPAAGGPGALLVQLRRPRAEREK